MYLANFLTYFGKNFYVTGQIFKKPGECHFVTRPVAMKEITKIIVKLVYVHLKHSDRTKNNEQPIRMVSID